MGDSDVRLARDAEDIDETEEGLGKSLKETLRVSVEAKSDKARILRKMLASLEEDEEKGDDPVIMVVGTTGGGGNTMETEISTSTAGKTLDLDKEVRAQTSGNETRTGDEAAQSLSDEISPGDSPLLLG